MAPKLNRRRALFVLGRIDEILSWERTTEQERDTRFVELGRYIGEMKPTVAIGAKSDQVFGSIVAKRAT